VGNAAVYLTFDLDVLDFPWAPAVANPEVGGLTARQAIKLLRGLRGVELVGADFVCFCGRKDSEGEVTALTTAALMHETLTLLAESTARSAAPSEQTSAALSTS
jgi:guanidinopropionase